MIDLRFLLINNLHFFWRKMMDSVKRIFVEKKAPFAVKAKELKTEIESYLGISSVTAVREFIRYDVENISEDIFEIVQ